MEWKRRFRTRTTEQQQVTDAFLKILIEYNISSVKKLRLYPAETYSSEEKNSSVLFWRMYNTAHERIFQTLRRGDVEGAVKHNMVLKKALAKYVHFRNDRILKTVAIFLTGIRYQASSIR